MTTSGRIQFSYTVLFPASYRFIVLNPTSEPIQLQGTIELVNPGLFDLYNVNIIIPFFLPSGPNHMSTADAMEGQAVRAMFILNFATLVMSCSMFG